MVKAGVTLNLLLTDKIYDPIVPKNGSLTCVVRNDTPRRIRIPVGYDDHTVESLFDRHRSLSRTSSGMSTSAGSAKDGLRMVDVHPGAEQVLFEAPLDDILAKGDAPNRNWQWSGPSKKIPPLLPIHQPDGAGYLKEATFQVKMNYGNYDLVSNRSVLKFGQSESAK